MEKRTAMWISSRVSFLVLLKDRRLLQGGSLRGEPYKEEVLVSTEHTMLRKHYRLR